MKRLSAVVLLVLFLASGVWAQANRWEFRFGPRIIGAFVGARYMLQDPTADDVETSITGLLSGAYQSTGYYRTADGAFVTPSAVAADDSIIASNRLDFGWEIGVQQGIVPRGDVEADAAVVFVLYRGHLAFPFRDDNALFFQSGSPDVEGSLRGSVVSGVAWSAVTRSDVTRVRRGAEAELALEWGPEFLHNRVVSEADYSRWTVRTAGFLPLFELPPAGDFNRFSVYTAGFAAVDWATGPVIPDSIRSTLGGRSVRSAPGGSVRGYGAGRFDSTLKAVGNVELRAALPAIILPSIVPGFVVYTDAGYYLDAQARSPVDAENSSLLVSSGAGVSLDLFNAVQLVFYTSYLWTETGNSGERWVPFSVGFGFHF